MKGILILLLVLDAFFIGVAIKTKSIIQLCLTSAAFLAVLITFIYLLFK